MSRIGKRPILLDSTVKIKSHQNQIIVEGPKGQLTYLLSPGISIEESKQQLLVRADNINKITRQLHGLSRTMLNNMIIGVTKGFCKELEIRGVGYKAQVDARQNLILNVGYSHPIYINIPSDIKIKIEDSRIIKIQGINKEKVGQLTAKIRSIRPPEPYKGKGIRYYNEKIRKKVGKAGK